MKKITLNSMQVKDYLCVERIYLFILCRLQRVRDCWLVKHLLSTCQNKTQCTVEQ